jgi:fucose 4-O-acetylase-like acetyltransferase
MSKSNQRNINIDLIKGTLVIAMIFYHCTFNISGQYLYIKHNITETLEFLHYAFLFISGYLCGFHYLPLSIEGSSHKVGQRLRIRALKIFLIFLLANVTLYVLGFAYSIDTLLKEITSFHDIATNFILNVNGSFAAFEVLYYIAAFLFLVSYLLTPIRILIFCALMAFMIWNFSENLFLFVLIGSIGMVLGWLKTKETFNKFEQVLETAHGLFPIILFILFQIYKSNLYIYIQEYPLLVLFMLILETLLWFATFISIIKLLKWSWLTNILVIFGKYTLFAYIVQMFLIRIGAEILEKFGDYNLMFYTVTLLISTIILYLLILLLDNWRHNQRLVNNIYKWIFS